MANKVFKPKSKQVIKEATDIVLNTETDDAAIDFLRDTLEDDFPDLDLGRMDLHKAIEVLGKNENKKTSNMKNIENLNKTLSKFMGQADKKSAKKAGKKNKKKRK